MQHNHDALHNLKNTEERIFKKPTALHATIPGSTQPIGLKGSALKVARFHTREKGWHKLLCYVCMQLGLPAPEVMARDVAHRLLIITGLAHHMHQYALAYQMAAQLYEPAGKQQQQGSDAQGKLTHLHEIVMELRNPLLQLLAALGAFLHPYSLQLYTILNLNSGFVLPNIGTWLREHVHLLHSIAANPRGVLGSLVDMSAMRDRFGVSRQLVAEAAATWFIDRLRCDDKLSKEQPSCCPEAVNQTLAPQFDALNKADLQPPPWIMAYMAYDRILQAQQGGTGDGGSEPPAAAEEGEGELQLTNLRAVQQYMEDGSSLSSTECRWLQHAVEFAQSFFEPRSLAEVLAAVTAAFRDAATYLHQAAAPYLSSITAQVAAVWQPGPEGTRSLLLLLHMRDLYHAGGREHCCYCVAYAAAARFAAQHKPSAPQVRGLVADKWGACTSADAPAAIAFWGVFWR